MSMLDEFMPWWQFAEHHMRNIAAPPERVYAAVKAIRADEILFFRTLTGIRRGWRHTPQGILHPGTREPLLDVATRTGFIWLADDPPCELVLGTAVICPPGAHDPLTPDLFRRSPGRGYALGAMNFELRPDDRGGSVVSTETRVHATDDRTRRRFAWYWRVIRPGSGLIRRMWLRAIERRALTTS